MPALSIPRGSKPSGISLQEGCVTALVVVVRLVPESRRCGLVNICVNKEGHE